MNAEQQKSFRRVQIQVNALVNLIEKYGVKTLNYEAIMNTIIDHDYWQYNTIEEIKMVCREYDKIIQAIYEVDETEEKYFYFDSIFAERIMEGNDWFHGLKSKI